MAAEPLAARTSLLPVLVSVQAAARIPPVMPHQTSLGAQKCGLPLKPTASRRVQTPARSASPQQCHVSPATASWVSQTEFRLSSHPHLQTMHQGAHTIRLLPTDRSGGVKHAVFCPWDGVHLLPTAEAEPEVHCAMTEGKSKQNLPLTYCVWSV